MSVFEATEDDLLNELFPFRIVFDAEMRVLAHGDALAKLCSDFRTGCQLGDLVEFSQPRSQLSIQRVRRKIGRLISVIIKSRAVELRGQVIQLNDDQFMFVGSPLLDTPEDLQTMGISFNDFAAHDATVENVFMRQTQKTQLQELKQLVNQLEQSAEERRKLSAAEQSLAHDLEAAGDLIIRIGKDHQLLEVRSTKAWLLPDNLEQRLGESVYKAFPFLYPDLETLVGLTEEDGPIAIDFESSGGAANHFLECRVMRTLSGDTLLLAS